jgi:hypothetical protein
MHFAALRHTLLSYFAALQNALQAHSPVNFAPLTFLAHSVCLQDLINLRIASNAVYFTGRAVGGEDSIEALTSRAATYAKRVKW